jgi:hypothetical protein
MKGRRAGAKPGEIKLPRTGLTGKLSADLRAEATRRLNDRLDRQGREDLPILSAEAKRRAEIAISNLAAMPGHLTSLVGAIREAFGLESVPVQDPEAFRLARERRIEDRMGFGPPLPREGDRVRFRSPHGTGSIFGTVTELRSDIIALKDVQGYVLKPGEQPIFRYVPGEWEVMPYKFTVGMKDLE